MPTLTRNQKSINDARIALHAGEMFLLKYDAKLPPDLGLLCVGGFGAHFDVNLMHRDQCDRDKALAHLGEVFGRSGWEAKLSAGYHQFHGYDWRKEVDGVLIQIEGAQPTGQPKSFPVDPKQFPLQIEDAQPA